jgi:hypothetical protein
MFGRLYEVVKEVVTCDICGAVRAANRVEGLQYEPYGVINICDNCVHDAKLHQHMSITQYVNYRIGD